MTTIIIISLLVFAIHYTMQQGEIFGFVGGWLSHLPKWTHNPLYECPVCMVPWYGTPLFLLITDTRDVLQITISIIASMGLNAVILKLMPDKETPTIHKELQDIADNINKQTEEFRYQNEKHREFSAKQQVEAYAMQLENHLKKATKIKATGKPKIHKTDS